jgi:hypothetical protein
VRVLRRDRRAAVHHEHDDVGPLDRLTRAHRGERFHGFVGTPLAPQARSVDEQVTTSA